MKIQITQEKADMIRDMEKYLNEKLANQPEKLWENTFIRKQIEKREQGGTFSIEDHIRAMVYAMLSGAASWTRIIKNADRVTGCIPEVDEIFQNYQVDRLLSCSSDQISGIIGMIKYKKLGNQLIEDQVNALYG